MATQMRQNSKIVSELLESSSTYMEFKIKLDIAGISMYNIAILKSLRWRIEKNKRSFYKQFENDVSDNINNIKPTGYVEEQISRIVNDKNYKLKSFDVFITQTWITKNEYRYTKSKYVKSANRKVELEGAN